MNSNFENHVLVNKENLQISCVDTFDCSGQQHCVVLTYLHEVVSAYLSAVLWNFLIFSKLVLFIQEHNMRIIPVITLCLIFQQ